MSGLGESMVVKPSLFVLAEVSTDLKQLGRRLPSDYQKKVSNLPSPSSYTPPLVRRNDRTHESWKYKDIFVRKKLAIWPQMSRTGARWPRVHCQPTFFYTSKLRPLRASCWCFAMTSVWKYPQLTRTKVWAFSKLCGQIGLVCTFAGKSGRDPCKMLSEGNCEQQNLSPVTCPQGLPGKVWQGLYRVIEEPKTSSWTRYIFFKASHAEQISRAKPLFTT